MTFASEHLHNLTSARRLAVHSTRLNPIARAGTRFDGHLFTSFDSIKPLRPESAIGNQREAGCGHLPIRPAQRGRGVRRAPCSHSTGRRRYASERIAPAARGCARITRPGRVAGSPAQWGPRHCHARRRQVAWADREPSRSLADGGRVGVRDDHCPSGSGKSTLLDLIGSLDRPEAGSSARRSGCSIAPARSPLPSAGRIT